MTDQALQRIEKSQELSVAPSGLFGTNEPVAVIGQASKVAGALKEVIRTQGLISKIGGKEYPRCEAWTLLGTMLGVFPVLCWTRPIEHGWEARVEARTRDGNVVGAAEAQCLRTEANWRNRDDFALRSMAQTRATAKCLRMPLGFVMTLAGYEATPAEEMVSDRPVERKSIVKALPPVEKAEQVVKGVTVEMVTEKTGMKKNGQPWTAYFFLFNDGTSNLEAATFSKTLAGIAQTITEAKGKAEITIKPGNKPGTFELVNILPMPDDDTIPEGVTP